MLLILEPLSEQKAGQMCSEMWDYVHGQWVGNGWVYGQLTHSMGKGLESSTSRIYVYRHPTWNNKDTP